MYHITDFEAAFESEKEDDPLVEHPQQQRLPVEDNDDVAQCTQTVHGRRYLRHVRHEAAKYRVIRDVNQSGVPPRNSSQLPESNSTKQTSTWSHPIWNSKTLVSDTIRNFKYSRKLVRMQRKQVSEKRADFGLKYFDMARAVRTRQWWLEYCFGSPRSRAENPWEEDCNFLKDFDANNGDEDEEEEEDEDDDEEEYANEKEKLDFDTTKVAIGESVLGSLQLCASQATATGMGSAYVNGHQPQISFLCELDQTEVIRVLRFFRIWLRRDGYRPQLGLWLYGLLSLLDPVQTGDVYHELRLLFSSCNHARMQTLMDASAIKTERDKNTDGLVASTCNALSRGGTASVTSSKCVGCERVRHLHKQHSTLCLIMLVIGHYFAQRDLISALQYGPNGQEKQHQ